MHLILNLTPETEAMLREQASQAGSDPEEFALQALQQRLEAEASSPSLTPQARMAELRAWFASHPRSEAKSLDDSRESIYAGRGE